MTENMSKTKLLLAAQRIVRERDAIETDRLRSLGLLAAGIAHEINSPLTWMATSLRFAIEELAASSPDVASIRSALADAESGSDLVLKLARDLTAFARHDDPTLELGPMDVRRAVEAALRIAGPQVHLRASLVVDLQDVPPVIGIERRLMQVVVNLVVNAAQALPETWSVDSRVRVSTRSAEDGSAVIEVSDTGSGIPPNLKRKIFEPLYTTKAMGTGLGLSISHGIVASFGGTLSVHDAVPHGAIFSVLLPAASPLASPFCVAPRINGVT